VASRVTWFPGTPTRRSKRKSNRPRNGISSQRFSPEPDATHSRFPSPPNSPIRRSSFPSRDHFSAPPAIFVAVDSPHENTDPPKIRMLPPPRAPCLRLPQVRGSVVRILRESANAIHAARAPVPWLLAAVTAIDVSLERSRVFRQGPPGTLRSEKKASAHPWNTRLRTTAFGRLLQQVFCSLATPPGDRGIREMTPDVVPSLKSFEERPPPLRSLQPVDRHPETAPTMVC